MKWADGTFTGISGSEGELFDSLLTGVEGIGVEIGCLDGYSSALILQASKLHLTSVDPFVPDSMESSLKGDPLKYTENTATFKPRGRLIKDYSWNVVKTWTEPLEFLFIDGDHNYSAVVRDYQDWTPFIKQGGLLAVHDSRMTRPNGARFHPGPSQMAAEMIFNQPSKWEIIGEEFSLTFAKKL